MNGVQLATRQDLSYPAVYEHEVVRVACADRNGQSAHIELIRRGAVHDVVRALPAGRLYVGIRAGRLTFATRDGTDLVGVTLLGDASSDTR